ncbi:hypothetical protein [Nocardioides sp. B-3]|uniref:hypothetical protein n=1 Tax=Nocardioides sp. B-3 TaxID=2895565 RepID=UPI00215335D3|nr:hypothetical protein [Nocardioides sp. B-3]UUZ58523.1 hypothetical protein LP418_20500 [Nocardioides sp. B-3]
MPPEQIAEAEAVDAEEDGEGWTCFGGTGLDRFQNVDDAPWIGARAPGGKESVRKLGYGVKLRAGSRIIMQVHYNLPAGTSPDTSAAQLRLAPGNRDMQQLHTMLLPAPVELPCRAAHADGPLCDRNAAMFDVMDRFGPEGSATANALYLLCGGEPEPGQVQSCTRTVREPMTIHATGGHMHLLGREIRIEVNPGTPEAKTVLDIPVWDFDDRGRARHRAGHPRARRHRGGHLQARAVVARPAAVLRGPARSLRRVGRGHHRRDVPGHAADHPSLRIRSALPRFASR